MNLNERNYAGDHVVCGSLEVLGDIKGSGITQIKRSVDLIQRQTEMAFKQQNQYWKDLSSDGIITPLEKQQLLKEMRSITNSYTAIYQQAVSLGLEGTTAFQDYMRVYNNLYSYLYVTLKLFDDMEQQTAIDSRDTFNEKFSTYYYDESFVLLAITKGILDTVSIRVLESLLDEGEEGEVAIYLGALYQYVNGEWKNVNTGNYKGALTTVPAMENDAFFLAADDILHLDNLYINGEPLYVNNDALGITRLFRKGYIYYCQDGKWLEEADKTNYKYVAAFADVLNVTGELPQIFQDALDELQDEITELQQRKTPTYRGLSSFNPQDPQPGDFFVYSGATTETRRKSDIYKYDNGEWSRLDPLLSQNNIYYMQALEDILSLNNAGDGYFAALFAQAFFTNAATMEKLSTKTIYLRQGGYIQSDDVEYEQGTLGLNIDYRGNIDANGDIHLGASSNNKVAIGVPLKDSQGHYTPDFDDYDVVIGGNCKFDGELNLSKNVNLSGRTVITGDAHFTGDIDSGPLYLTSASPTPVTISYAAGNSFPNINLADGTGTFGNIDFDKYNVTIVYGNTRIIETVYFYKDNVLVYENSHNIMESAFILPYDFTFTYNIASDAKTFMLRNLPTTRPAEANVVWNDNGTLKLS